MKYISQCSFHLLALPLKCETGGRVLKRKHSLDKKNVLSDPGPGDVRRCFKKGRGILKFESAAGETLESKLLKVAALFPQLSSPLLNAKKNEEDDYFGLDASAFIRLCKDFEGR